MGWSENAVTALCIGHQKLLQVVSKAIHENLRGYLPPVTDVCHDLEKNKVDWFSEESLALNDARLAGLCCYAIVDAEGAAVTRLKATLNILYSIARLLHSTTPEQVSELLLLITKIYVPHNGVADEKAGWLKMGAGFASNLTNFLKIRDFWKNNNLEESCTVAAAKDIYDNYLYFFTSQDYAYAESEYRAISLQFELLTDSILPFITEVDSVLNLQPGTIAHLLGLNKPDPRNFRERAGSMLNLPVLNGQVLSDNVLNMACVLQQIEEGNYFDKNPTDAAVSSLQSLKEKGESLHTKILASINEHVEEYVSVGYQDVDRKGFLLPHRNDSVASVEIKILLNGLHDINLILGKADKATFPTLTLISCIMRIRRLYHDLMNLKVNAIAQHYIVRVNDFLRVILETLNPILELTVLTCKQIEIDSCSRRDFVCGHGLHEVCATYSLMCEELGANIVLQPPFTESCLALYRRCDEGGRSIALTLANWEKKCLADHRFLTKGNHKFTPLAYLPVDQLLLVANHIIEFDVSREVKQPYLDELDAAIAEAQSVMSNKKDKTAKIKSKKIPLLPYPAHPGLDFFLETTARQYHQLGVLQQQKQGIIKDHVIATHAMHKLTLPYQEQMIKRIQERRTQLFRRQQMLTFLRALREDLKGNRWLGIPYLAGVTDDHQPLTSVCRKIDKLLSDKLTLATAAEVGEKIKIELANVLSANNKPALFLPNAKATQDFYEHTYSTLSHLQKCELPHEPQPIEAESLLTYVRNKACNQAAPDVPIPSVKCQVQALTQFFHAWLVHGAKKSLVDSVAVSYPETDSIIEEQVLTQELFHYRDNTSQSTLDSHRAKMSLVPINPKDKPNVNNLKAYANLSLLTSQLARTLTQKSVDEFLRSLERTVDTLSSGNAKWTDKAVVCSRELYNALRILSMYLDNGWREQLTQLSKNIIYLNDSNLNLVKGQVISFIEDVQPSRLALVRLTEDFVSRIYLKAEIVQQGRNLYMDLFNKGMQNHAHGLVAPICHYSLWQVQRLSKIELGHAQTKMDEEWSSANFSRHVHAFLVEGKNVFHEILDRLFNQQTNDLFRASLPYTLVESTPQPLRELQIYLNIASHVDVLLKELNEDNNMLSRAWDSNRCANKIGKLTDKIKYQEALKEVVTHLNDYVSSVLGVIDIIIASAMNTLAALESALDLNEDVISQKFQLQQALRLYKNLAVVYQVNAVNSFNRDYAAHSSLAPEPLQQSPAVML